VRVGTTSLNKFETQSVFMIAIGCCQQSNGLQFYNPENESFFLSIDYKFQLHFTSGNHFGYKYQPGTFFYRLDELTTIFTTKYALDSEVLIHTHSPPHRAKIIGLPSYDCPDVYTVVYTLILVIYLKPFLQLLFCHGKLYLDNSNQWIFCSGQSTDLSQGILLDNLVANCQNLLDTGQFLRGHTKFCRVYVTTNGLNIPVSQLAGQSSD
jgi:hypothetical protein